MAAPSSPTGTIQHKIYINYDNTTTNSRNTLTKAKTAVSTLLGDVVAFGPITKTGNPSEYTPFGESTSKTIAGAASLGELTCRVVVTETTHATLLGKSPGDEVEVLAIKKDGSAEVGYYATGEFLSTETTFDTPGEYGFTIALSEEPSRLV